MKRPSIVNHQRLLSDTIYMGISSSALIPINSHKFKLTNADSVFQKYAVKHHSISDNKEPFHHTYYNLLTMYTTTCGGPPKIRASF
jgi:hypothetical protein